ncbi:OsmC family peroxiredoxin [Pontibacter beigongshangensis]|uniref:OsmC family peroxiredoxin n=1 Tax=Pontibacter beigongshangensis TaxID=2574733 RepID=UPI00164EF3A8|nr:OsmC family peroxiredoxin [Pontibacter beigongshangensis]
MKAHKASAKWNKGLKDGNGQVKTGNGTVEANYSFNTRFGDSTDGTTPEELIGAAHAGCFSMFLSALAGNKGLSPEYVSTDAKVFLGEKDGGPHIMKIELTTEASIPGISEEDFQQLAEEAKQNCPISKVLASVPEMTLQATLKA